MARARSQLRGRQKKPIIARVAKAWVWYGMPPAKRRQLTVPENRKFLEDWAGPKGKAGKRRRARRRARKRAVAISPTS